MRDITKRGQITQKIFLGIVISIIVVVVFLQVYESIVPTAQAAGDSLGDSDICSASGGFFNASQSLCLNGTNPEDTARIAFEAIPLSGLFSGDGVVFIIIMAAALLVIVVGFLRGRKD